MTRRSTHKATVTVEETGALIGEAEKFAHNTALDAGVAILRDHARTHGGYYERGEVLNSPRMDDTKPTVTRWYRRVTKPSHGEPFAVLITVERITP